MIPGDGIKDVKQRQDAGGRSAALPWRRRSRDTRDAEATRTQKTEQSKARPPKCTDGIPKGGGENGGWGLNMLHGKSDDRRSSSLKGSFVDLLGGSFLSELNLIDGQGSRCTSESSVTTFSSSNTEQMASSSSTSADSSRASSSSISSSRGSSENVEGFLDEIEALSTGLATSRRVTSQRTVRLAPPDKDAIVLENAKEHVNNDREEVEKTRSQQLFLAVKKNDEATVKYLHGANVSLESVDKYGMTPLMVACLDQNLCSMARRLIALGANLHAYRSGIHAGYPLHHAAKRGHQETVSVLLAFGANALAVNDDGQTPLDMARLRGHASTVRVIEDWICLFKGTLRQITDIKGSQMMKRVWAVVLPTDANPDFSRRELAIYGSQKGPLPESVILLGSLTCEFEEPDLSLPDPSFVVSDKVTKTRFKFFAQAPDDRKQLTAFYNACKGITQQRLPKSSSMPVLSSGGDSVLSRTRSEKPVQKKSSVFPEESLPKHCLVCRKAAAEATSIPCGHLSACMSCLSSLKKVAGGCPVCKAPIQQVVKVVIQQ